MRQSWLEAGVLCGWPSRRQYTTGTRCARGRVARYWDGNGSHPRQQLHQLPRRRQHGPLRHRSAAPFRQVRDGPYGEGFRDGGSRSEHRHLQSGSGQTLPRPGEAHRSRCGGHQDTGRGVERRSGLYGPAPGEELAHACRLSNRAVTAEGAR